MKAVAASARAADRRATQWRLSLLWAAAFLPVGLHLPYFPVWLAARGLDDATVAAILAAPLVVRVAVTPLVATVADRAGIAVTFCGCTLTVLCAYGGLAGADRTAAIFALAILVIAAQGSMPSLADALTLSEMQRIEAAGERRIEYGRMRMFASLVTLAMMLASAPLVAAMPRERIVLALVALAAVPAGVGSYLAWSLRSRRPRLAPTGRLTADAARLRLALVAIAAAALVQASHAEIYSFGTLRWQALGFSPALIGVAWATGVASETVLFYVTGSLLGGARKAGALLACGAGGAVLRWLAMGAGPPAALVLPLQTLHALSFAATYSGSVLLIGSLAGPTHRARMQGLLSAVSSLTLAGATLLAGLLTARFGDGAYLAMAALAAAGLALALTALALRRRLPPEGG